MVSRKTRSTSNTILRGGSLNAECSLAASEQTTRANTTRNQHECLSSATAAFQEVTKITESHLEKLDVILDSLQRVGERPLAHLHRLHRDPLQQLPRVNLITKMSFIILNTRARPTAISLDLIDVDLKGLLERLSHDL